MSVFLFSIQKYLADFSFKKNAFFRKRIWCFFLAGSLLLFLCGCQAHASKSIERFVNGFGSGRFKFIDTKGNKKKPITVYYYRPRGLAPASPILFVMHGKTRTAKRYRNAWKKYAVKYQFLLLAPKFSKKHFKYSRRYNRGNMFSRSKTPIDESRWTFSTIENLFDYVKNLIKSTKNKYFIYGHSAGGQFVHRLVLFKPHARFERAVAANSGWYAMPSFQIPFPYGLGQSGSSLKYLRKALNRNLVILVGEKDVDENHKGLKKSSKAMEQGKHRLERGRKFFEMGVEQSKKLGVELGWRFGVVPEAGHSNSRMAVEAVKQLFQ